MADTATEGFPKLQDGARFDVLIVGAGIVGVSLAYQLRGEGMSVGLVDAGSVLSAVTGHTTGKLTSQHGLIYEHLSHTFGESKARTYLEANEWAIDFVERLSEAEGIECDFVRDRAHVYAMSDDERKQLEDELKACEKIGANAEFVETNELPFGDVGALRFNNQARFHPRRFLLGLLERARAAGVKVFEHTRIVEIEEEASGVTAKFEGGKAVADRVVIATHYPIHDSGLFVARLAPYRSYAIAVEINGHLPDGMFITAGHDPMRSMRKTEFEGKELLIVGGENHKTGQGPDGEASFGVLESWARVEFDVVKAHFRWSTQDNWTPDRLPYVGRSPNRDRIYLAAGFGGWGMTNGIVSARLLGDLLRTGDSEWAEVYSPKRVDWAMVSTMVTENANSAKHLVGDRLLSAGQDSLDDVARGEGAVVQLDDKRVAAYRDDDGKLHCVTSACTHWGCQVHWNGEERSWDCPCHGSRFAIDGAVLHGPAVKPLEIVPKMEVPPLPGTSE